jgi:F-type H+-transporting ATPase subunit b
MRRALRLLLVAAALVMPSAAAAQGHHPEQHGVAEHGGHGVAEHGAHGVAEHGVAEHGVAEHGGHGGEHGHGSEAIDWNVMSGSFVNFGLWLALLYVLLRRPLSEFLTNRKAAVVEGLAEARRLKEEAEAKYREYSQRIDNLDAEIARLREEIRRGGLAERDRIVAEASRKAEKMRDEARFLVAQQLKQLREDLTREAIEAAVCRAEEILRSATTPQDQERLAREYLGTLRTSLRRKIEEKTL